MKEMIELAFKEIGEWSNKIAIHPVAMPPVSCNEIASIDSKSLSLMSLEQLEDLINKFLSYNIYVKTQRGSIEAQIEIVSSEVNQTMLAQVNGLGNDYRYKSFDEKIALVRSMNPGIDEGCRRVNILRAQLARIRDIPYAIDKKIDLLKTIYNKRISENVKRS